MRVVYKGDREIPDNYDHFTLDKEYQACQCRDYDNRGLLVLINDLGEVALQPSIDFDFKGE